MKRFLSSLALLLVSATALRAADSGFAVKQDAHGVSVTVNGQPFASYVIDQANKPYLWPVFGPTGKAMTRAFPMQEIASESKEQRDHPHHRGILFGHESSGTSAWSFPEKWDGITGGEKVSGGGDTWHERRTFEEYMETPKNALRGKQRMPMLARISHKEFTEVKAGSDRVVIAEVCEYLDPSGKRYLTEYRRLTFRASGETRSIDFDQDFVATDGPAKLEDRKDAGLSIRVPASMAVDSKQGGKIVNSEGATDADAWSKSAKWCDYHGPVEGEPLGIAFLNHPSSYRHPTRWHVRSYGLFTANPFAVHDFDKTQPNTPTELKAGERLSLRHRFIFHRGDAQAAKIEEAWTAYAGEKIAPVFAAAPTGPAPTLADVPYGSHERQVLDFYKAESDKPTPLLFFIHGGGWVGGDKSGRTGASVKPYLNAGISVVSINYRYSWQAQLAGVKPPVQAPLEDAARALQFVRSKAKEWNLDKQRIGASGGSAGACSSLWLALHPDMADPKSSDPIARESTRLWTAAVTGAQTSLDPQQLKEWTPNSRYGGHAFGFMDPNDLKTRDTRFAEFLDHRAEVLPWIKEYSPIEHASADDPPIYLIYNSAPALGEPQKDPTHTANYGVKLQEKLRSLGVACELVYPGAPDVQHKSIDDFLIGKLKK